MKFTKKELNFIISSLRFCAGVSRVRVGSLKAGKELDKLADKIEKELR